MELDFGVHEIGDDIDRHRMVRPIGVVRNTIQGPERPDWSMIESDLVIDPVWTEALEGVEQLERLAVL